ncbi:MAG: hypothetical protein AAGF97_00420, partial [Planctomycetota bacterium]
MHHRRQLNATLLILLCLLLPSLSAHAQLLDWTGAVDNQFFRIPGNWNPNSNPGTSSSIAFSGAPTAATGLRIFDNTSVSTTYVLESANVNFRPEGRFITNSLVVGGGRFAGSGVGDTAVLNLLTFGGNTILEADIVRVGDFNDIASSSVNGSTGRVVINPGTTLISNGRAIVGNRGNNGFVTVNGGTFLADAFDVGNFGPNPNALGYVVVAGQGSRLATNINGVSTFSQIGNGSRGTIEAFNGGSVELFDATVGGGSAGQLIASGAGSTVVTSELTIGGSGTVTAIAGGMITAGDVSAHSNSLIDVQGQNSLFLLTQLTQDAGGAIEIGHGATLGQNRFNSSNRISGSARIDGGTLGLNSRVDVGGSLELIAGILNTPTLHLAQGSLAIHGGLADLGELTTTTGATVDWTGGNIILRGMGSPHVIGNQGLFDQQVAVPAGSALTIQDPVILDGTLEVRGSLSTQRLRHFGTLELHDATVAGAVELFNGSTTELTGMSRFLGTVSGRADFSGTGTISFADLYQPGDRFDTDRINFDGNVIFEPTSTLELELLDNLSGFDRLNVAGTLTLGGSVDVMLPNGFMPSLGDQFDLLDFSSLVDDGLQL